MLTCEHDNIVGIGILLLPSCLMESPKVLATGLLTECLQIMYVGVSADTLLEKQGKKIRTVNKIYSSFDNQIV